MNNICRVDHGPEQNQGGIETDMEGLQEHRSAGFGQFGQVEKDLGLGGIGDGWLLEEDVFPSTNGASSPFEVQAIHQRDENAVNAGVVKDFWERAWMQCYLSALHSTARLGDISRCCLGPLGSLRRLIPPTTGKAKRLRRNATSKEYTLGDGAGVFTHGTTDVVGTFAFGLRVWLIRTNLFGTKAGMPVPAIAAPKDWPHKAQGTLLSRDRLDNEPVLGHDAVVTISICWTVFTGQGAAVAHAKRVFDEEKKFARLLKVGTAYHSHHMLPCGDPYVQSLRDCGIRVQKPERACAWFSSATPSATAMGPLGFVIEVGPHPALKGPAIQNIADIRPSPLPYTGVLSRGKDDVKAFSDALGLAWAHLGARRVDFASYEALVAGSDRTRPKLIVGLPSYQWNHGRTHLHESRGSRKLRGRKQVPHEILGVLSPDSTPLELRCHQLQGQVVFPAAGYIAMALEAARKLAADRPVEIFELHNLNIPRAITFEEDSDSGVETLVTLTGVTTAVEPDKTITAAFSCYSGSGITDVDLELMASGTVKIVLGVPDVSALNSTLLDSSGVTLVDCDRFYSSLSKLGYGYSGNFRGISSLQRRFNQASVLVDVYHYSMDDTSVYIVHPTMLDVSFQAFMLAYSAPGDERLWSLHVPTSIRSIRVNPELCSALPIRGSQLPVSTVLADSESFYGSIDIFNEEGTQAMVQVEDLTIKPFAPATETNDQRLFSSIANRWVSYHYLRKWKSEISEEQWLNGQPHHARLRDYVEHTLATVAKGQHPYLKREWSEDSPEFINQLINRYDDSIDIRLLSAVGENIPAAVRGETTILEHMLPNNMLDDFYTQGLGFARYNSFLAAMMKQVAHRYPHAKILEIGAGTGGATRSVLGSMGDTMSSYTYTDVSVGFFEKAAEVFKAYNGRYEPHIYDIVIASNVLHATASLHKTLSHIRCSCVMCGLPGWWVGADDGRRVDAITPGIDAVDDCVGFLRRPLSSSPSSSASICIDSLVVVGTGSLVSSRLAEELTEHLGRFCGQITVLRGLPTEAEAEALPPLSAVVNLADLDAPVFKGITSATMDGLKRIFEVARQVLWVTAGAQADQPYHMASIAFSRAMSHEAGHISFKHIDFSSLAHDTSAAKLIAEHLLRQCALDEWQGSYDHRAQQQKHFLWCQEPEVFLDRGDEKIPRLVNSVEQNACLNSSRRSITASVPIAPSNITIFGSPDEPPALVQDVMPVQHDDNDENLFQVSSSSLMALLIAPDSFLFLGASKKDALGGTTLVLSTINSCKTTPGARLHIGSGPVASSSDSLLISFAGELLAANLVESLPSGSSLLLLCSPKDGSLAAALSGRCAGKGVRSTFACNMEDVRAKSADSSWLKLSMRSPRHVLPKTCPPQDMSSKRHVLQKMIRAVRPTHFLDLSASSRTLLSPLGDCVAKVLGSSYRRIELSSLSQHQASQSTACSQEVLLARLEDAVSGLERHASFVTESQAQPLILELSQINERSTTYHPTSVVHWAPDGDVKVQVRPLDGRRLFAANKTYLLIGLTGQIGQSLCEWMVASGAGCVCLTSRSPKTNSQWLQSFEGTGATVKAFAMDITDKHSVEQVVNNIKATCPPIAGVANGAMVLHNALFSGMSTETMQEVLGPNIDGTNHLDQIFHHDLLDFFILFYSSACVIGNSGQTNYAAANGYLNSLARQRRRRGLAASTLDIGRVAGLGYVETAGQAVMDQLTRFGLMAISESEFRQMFAETILAGYPAPEDKAGIPNAVVTTGIRTIRDDEEIQGPWFDNPRFSHCIIEAGHDEAESGQQSKKALLPVTEQLSGATSKDEALQILHECFSAKLRIILQLSEEEIALDSPLVELGVDSLVAVEVRSWFLKELKVDIPVLKVVGGASITELCQRALEKLPAELLTGSGGNASGKKMEPGKQRMLPVPQPASIPTPATSDSSSASEYLSTPGGRQSPETPLSAPLSQLSSRKPSSENLTKETKEKSTARNPAVVEPAKRTLTKFIKSELISFGQSRFWFLSHLLKDQTTSNVAFYYHIDGNLRIGDLERAVRIVTTRHEALRTCFVGNESKADEAYQKVTASSKIRLEHKKVKDITDVKAEYAKLQSHVFDLASGEMLRLLVLTRSPSSHYLLVNYHHIVMDGVSFQVLLSDLEKAYKGEYLGSLPRQFPDFAAAQRRAFENGEMDEDLAYWRGVFPAGKQPPVLPLLPMASAISRMPMKDFGVNQVSARIGPAMASRMKVVSKAQRATLFHFYLAAFKTMLFAFAPDAQELTIGIADANRHDSDVLGSIGFFLNLLTLRFRRQAAQQFGDAVAEARATAHAALAHSRIPFDVLLAELNVERSSSHSPFFQAFFDYRQGAQEKHAWANTQFEFQEVHPGRTAYDVTLDVTDSTTGALVILRAQKGLYDLTAVNLLLETYLHFLDTLSRDSSILSKDIPLFGDEQLIKATQIGRGPKLVSGWPETLPLRIDEIAESNPNKVALMDGLDNRLTYSEMTDRIEAVADAMQRAGIENGARVLVFQQATVDWVCSMLAIMRIGCIYVPLDLRNPLPRLAAVAADCEPRAILVDDTMAGDVTQLGAPSASVINVTQLGPRPASGARIPNISEADSQAAILYTSGSTGTPKGIMVTHAGLRNEIEGYTKTWGLGAERTLQQSAFTFNHSSDQIYTGLVNGGTVYIAAWAQRGDPLELTRIIREHGITYTKATPSEYALWMQYAGDNLKGASSWQFGFGGGEPLPSTLLRSFAGLGLPQLRLFNSYGPTEISISSTKMEIAYLEENSDESRIACGYSLPNYYTYVVDEYLNPLPAGMPGELCIGGAGVSLGYLNNEELTRQHFVANPFTTPEDIARGWTRMYRTGDIGHLRDDGAMVFHSRMAGDTQVKIRGLRIELCDIESNIVTTSAGVLREAVVTQRGGDPGFLVAHVVFAPGHNIADQEAFLQRLVSRLPIPQYMVPVVAIPVDKFPLTNHSKVDRKAVKTFPLPQQARSSSMEKEELSETMVQLKELWEEVLGNKELGFDITASTDFFSVGGNSLLAIRLQSRIRQVFDVTIRLVDLLGASALGRMAREIDESSAVGVIDWETETAPPSVPGFLQHIAPAAAGATAADPERPKTIVVTGATGFLAKTLLPQLAARADIGTIHCVAVRGDPTTRPVPCASSPKIVTHAGDLTRPLLGLSRPAFAALAADADAIVHLGAARAFWDGYGALRAANVGATRELVKLALPRQVPIHYVSTALAAAAADADVTTTAEAEAAPPADADADDGSVNGYVATRWASERLLRRAGLPGSSVVRFLPAPGRLELDTPRARAVLDELVRLADAAGAVPDMAGWEGRMDLVPTAEAAGRLCEAVVTRRGGREPGAPEEKNGEERRRRGVVVEEHRHESTVGVDVAVLREHMLRERGGLESMPGLKWFGRIKSLGFGYLLAAQDASIPSGDGDGGRFVSRR
ncbi:hypothetical protein GGR56DRAFT_665124 [Xylariaceae sp. FL0804]|nr:hypothetical protein GGR56DRAFT_665124 [Xylariaceae sp. FL0804]